MRETTASTRTVVFLQPAVRCRDGVRDPRAYTVESGDGATKPMHNGALFGRQGKEGGEWGLYGGGHGMPLQLCWAWHRGPMDLPLARVPIVRLDCGRIDAHHAPMNNGARIPNLSSHLTRVHCVCAHVAPLVMPRRGGSRLLGQPASIVRRTRGPAPPASFHERVGVFVVACLRLLVIAPQLGAADIVPFAHNTRGRRRFL